MKSKYSLIFKNTVLWSVFLVPALLLSTPNFSVAVIAFVVFISLGYLVINRRKVELDLFDGVVLVCLSFYFLGAIPIAIADGTTTRYFQGGIRLLLCIPIYISLRHYLIVQHISLRSSFEIGVIFGSISTFSLAIYQSYFLNMPRVDGFLFSINFGYLACSIAFIALALLFNSTKKIWLTISFLAAIISVFLTVTRGAIFAIPILLTLCLVLKLRHLSKKTVFLGIILFTTMNLAAYNHIPNYQQRIDFTVYEFTSIASGDIDKAQSSGDRLQYWIGAIYAFEKSPLFGLTYKGREQLNHELYLEGKINERASKVSRGHAHNQYFEMLASNGALGIISILTVFVIPFILCVTHYRQNDSDWALCGTVFIAAFMVFGLTEVPLTANLIGSFYGFMLAVFFANISAEKHRWKQREKQ